MKYEVLCWCASCNGSNVKAFKVTYSKLCKYAKVSNNRSKEDLNDIYKEDFIGWANDLFMGIPGISQLPSRFSSTLPEYDLVAASIQFYNVECRQQSHAESCDLRSGLEFVHIFSR